MNHLPWFSQSQVCPVKVPFICGNEPLCSVNNFTKFGKLGTSTSLLQLATRAQAWLFFGLLATCGISPDICISSDASGTDDLFIDTSELFFNVKAFIGNTNGRPNPCILESLIEADRVMRQEVLPLIRTFETGKELTLWNSSSFAVLFSIDILIDSLSLTIQGAYLRPESLLPKETAGIAHSLQQAGKCGSLAHRLGLRSADFYLLMSLPCSVDNEDHSQCSQNSCKCFDADPASYRPRHVQDCVLCEDMAVMEEDLAKIIQKDEVPLIRSVMNSDGVVTISVTRMKAEVDYTAISHVWSGGLGNFESNWLPQCQLQTIHQDVCNTLSLSNDSPDSFLLQHSTTPRTSKLRIPNWLRSRRTTCYYWLDTLCIPINCPEERRRAINSMGRIYAGAAKVLVLDPALARINYNDLGGENGRRDTANLLISASPWMARSWPLQEAALAPFIHTKFADGCLPYRHSRLGIAVNLPSIPNQKENEERLSWYGGLMHDFGPGIDYSHSASYVPDGDFISIWNLLAKRTTSYPEDIPAIFAALIHKSAGEILAIEPDQRSRALLHSLNSLPLDILCVEQGKQDFQDVPHNLGWAPRLPGSKKPVPLLDSRWGTLKRVSEGFLLKMNQADPMATRAIICPSGSIPVGPSVIRDVGSQAVFHLNVDESLSECSENTRVNPGNAQLLLLLSKEHSVVPSHHIGLLFTVVAEERNSLRVRLDSTLDWTLENDTKEGDAAIDCSMLDRSSRILIEMDFTHWPILKWSRFKAFPYQHLQAQQIDTTSIQKFYLVFSTLLPAFFASLFSLLVLIDSRFPISRVGKEWHSFILPCFIGSLVSIIPQWYFANKDGAFAGASMTRRARYLWALSFWDVENARRTLTRFGGSVSLALFIRTFIPVIINGLILTYGIKNGAAKSVIFFGMVPGLLTSVLRLLFLVFLQAQWFFSTFEFRSYPSWVLSHLKLTEGLMQAHFFRCLFVVLAGVFAGICTAMTHLHYAIFMEIWTADVPIKSLHVALAFVAGVVLSVLLLLVWIGAGCGCAVFICYQIWLLARDVVRRVRAAYAPEGVIQLV